METTVKFFTENDTESAFSLAKATQKPVLIDYWATNCKGCEKMNAVTYKDPAVLDYLEEHYVVIKCHVSNITRELSRTLLTTALLWSPSLFVYSPEGVILRTAVGYYTPGQFITELSIGKSALLMRKGKHAAALELLNNLQSAAVAYPALDQERLYWAGVAAYFARSKEFSDIAPYWKTLVEIYPDSIWADKANVLPQDLLGK